MAENENGNSRSSSIANVINWMITLIIGVVTGVIGLMISQDDARVNESKVEIAALFQQLTGDEKADQIRFDNLSRELAELLHQVHELELGRK